MTYYSKKKGPKSRKSIRHQKKYGKSEYTCSSCMESYGDESDQEESRIERSKIETKSRKSSRRQKFKERLSVQTNMNNKMNSGF